MAEVVATSASLRIFGDTLDPAEISDLLKCSPSSSERQGEVVGPKLNFVARTGGWKLRIERAEGSNLDQQIADLLSQMVSDVKIWRHLTSNYKVDMFCGIWLDEPGQGLGISPATLRSLAERGIALELDVYFPDTEDAQPVTK